MCRLVYVIATGAALLGFAVGCGETETEADRVGVGAECTASAECESPDEIELVCLTQFAGGYCGFQGCTGDAHCPEGSACVAHEDGNNYCFRVCQDKPECNRNRSVDNQSNCSANIVFVEEPQERKACVPPSSGI